MAKKTMARKTTALKKRPARATASKSTATPDAAPPAAASKTDPSAEELAAQGLALLRQALLSQQPADQPRPSPAFGIPELERSLAVLLGEGYAARWQRLVVAVGALEKRVFSEKLLDQLAPDVLLKLYHLAVRELDKNAEYMMDVFSRADATQWAAEDE